MTAATTRSAYPRTVAELIPHARDLAQQLGTLPSRNQLMTTFKVGGPKAKALLAALAPAPAEPAGAEPEPAETSPAAEPAVPAPPLPAINPHDEMTWVGIARTPAAPIEHSAPALVTPEQPATTQEPNRPRRPVRPAAVMALLTSTATAITGGILTSRFGSLALESWPAAVTAAVAALAVLAVLAWSAGSVLGAVFSGRSSRDVSLDVASWVVAGVAGFLAAYGQVRFAEWAGVTGGERFLVPGILEPAVVVLLLLANRRVKRRRDGHPAKPIGKLLALAAVLGGFAVYTNVVHAGGRAGLVFGAATVVGLILWWVKLQDDAAPDMVDDEPRSKRLSRRTSRYRLLRWIILFGQTRRAWLISLDHSIADAEVGLDLARRWRRAYDEARDAKSSRRRARQHAAQQIDAYLLGQN
ncbi:hypothetical protein QLQ12_25070 [Actinoplanes sp. NEAU-A12]|uniref:Uncharacterized protein n=1 Tax=Actinoplanes sandaracinus TaxID=3045177 RepID=A0ABT6WQ83_9ACTN|nr:hypothetical protein [Actinoplanes sandaracinus]MDI6101895.1 hypothetical protein [Actinoplanes sandaracinus]